MDNKNENILIDQYDKIEIPEEQLPDVISEQYSLIVEIDKKIIEAEEKCKQAKEIADKQVQLKLGNNKEVIVSTQNAVKSIVEAQTSLSEAQKLLFENQQKMAEGMRFLLILGSESIAMNRRVVAELEMKLKKASEEELSKAARLELINVIKLLREQESAFSKQDRMSEQLSKNTMKIDEIIVTDERQDQKDVEHDALIQENSDINNKQQIEIERQKQIDDKHDKDLKTNKTISIIGLVIALVAFLLALIALFK